MDKLSISSFRNQSKLAVLASPKVNTLRPYSTLSPRPLIPRPYRLASHAAMKMEATAKLALTHFFGP
jgi:hypothetical protein